MKNIISFFGVVLISILVCMGIVKLWFPDAIQDTTFVKLVVTFGILAVGAVLMNLIGSTAAPKDEEEK